MLKTIIQGRGTGKTTKAITLLEAFDDAILLTTLRDINRIYPWHIQNRVFTIDNYLRDNIRGIRYKKVIIDEGFLDSKDALAHLYYKLGKENLEVISIGSIDDEIKF